MMNKALTVTALTKYIKLKFDSDVHMKDVLLEGEISNFKHNVRGHFYFTLKDDKAAISAVMFKSHAVRIRFTPKDGMKVLVRGYVSVFEAAGSYQIYAESMEEVGLGNLYQAYLELKERLEKEGLFDHRFKKELPPFPKQIAVLTSATGAAVRDIINIINRRWPLAKILVYPTTVQGENAKDEIVANLRRADANKDNDVIILGRGGGSIEDLWAFNEEIVARAIFDTAVPVISAVGHETDFTIADFVADLRAPTPSGAAEIAVPDSVALHRDIENYRQRAADTLQRIIRQKQRNLNQSTDRYVLTDPSRIVMTYAKPYEHLYDKLKMLHPSRRLSQSADTLLEKEKQLHRAYQWSIRQKQEQFSKMTEHLQYVNPLSIMRKGYTLTKKQGKIIKSIKDINQGDTVEIAFHDGYARATIIQRIKDGNDE